MTSGWPAAALREARRALGAAFGRRAKQSERAWSGEGDLLRYARSAFPGYEFRTVFDVGAHVGAVSARFLDCFPGCALHVFEPAPETFGLLTAAIGGRQDVTLNEIALSDRDGKAAFSAQGDRTFNRILSRDLRPADRANPSVVQVKTETGDGYCARMGVTAISFLKIDSEGHDLRVLDGFSGLLAAQAVDFIQVEAGMHPENNRHVPFEQLKSRLESDGYRLFRIYGQSGDPKLKILRRSDLLFVSLKLADAYRAARSSRG